MAFVNNKQPWYLIDFKLDPDLYSKFSRTNGNTENDNDDTIAVAEAIVSFCEQKQILTTQEKQLQSPDKNYKVSPRRENIQERIKVSIKNQNSNKKSPYKKRLDVNDVEFSKQSPQAAKGGQQNLKAKSDRASSNPTSPRRATVFGQWSPFSNTSIVSPYAMPLPRSKRTSMSQTTGKKRAHSKKHHGSANAW